MVIQYCAGSAVPSCLNCVMFPQWRRIRIIVVLSTLLLSCHRNTLALPIARNHCTKKNVRMAASTTVYESASSDVTIKRDYKVSAAFFPLEGFFLPLHVSILLFQEDEGIHKFDFLPVNPRDPNTLQKLVTMKPVPGFVRYTTTAVTINPSFVIRLGTAKNMDLQTLQKFCKEYQCTKGNLHLITNNCFSFAYELFKCTLEFST